MSKYLVEAGLSVAALAFFYAALHREYDTSHAFTQFSDFFGTKDLEDGKGRAGRDGTLHTKKHDACHASVLLANLCD